MIVCIAEKPSVAKDIARVVGATTPHDGYLEGNGYQVTWTFGHLCCLKEPDDYTPEWKYWSLSRLPMIPSRFGIKLIPGNKVYARQFHIIETLMQNAESIVNCGDAGQEGELIQRWVMQKAQATCPVQRLWISSLTEESIREGFRTLRPQNDYTSLYQAGLCRAIGDWLLGMNATRLYTLKYRPRCGSPNKNSLLLSIGRVQTPTLAMIVKRQQDIENFVSEQYFVLATIYRGTLFNLRSGEEENNNGGAVVSTEDIADENTGAKTSMPKSRFVTRVEGEKALAAIDGKEFEVTDVCNKNSNEASPRLFDLTSLQVECNKKYSFSAEDTLKYIQSLYEKKLTTYPRVDTTYLSEDIYSKCPKILQGLEPYANYTQPLLQAKLRKSKRVFDSSKVTDHHAIIPTGVSPVTVGLNREEKLVYDLVTRRFISAFYPDCKGAVATVEGCVGKLRFRATGKQILDPGWRVVFEKKNTPSDAAIDASTDAENDENNDEEKTLPNFRKGEKGSHKPTLTEKWTTPPKPYTEATLLRAMETAGKMVDNDELRYALKENGIGRPSTRAAIIETLFKRGYIVKQRKSLTATPTGVSLINVIHADLLKSAELTGQWEKKLREIEAHKYDATQFIEELKQMVITLVQEVMSDNSNHSVTASFTERMSVNGDGDSIAGNSSPSGLINSGETGKEPFPVKTKSPRKTRSKKKEAKSKENPLIKEGDVCPVCGKGIIIRGHTALGCSEWRNGCTFRQPLAD